MGRKTLESLPKLLPKRKHIVLSRRSNDNRWINYLQRILDYLEKLILTEIDVYDKDTDVFFPMFNKDEWYEQTLSEHFENNISYKHKIYTRK